MKSLLLLICSFFIFHGILDGQGKQSSDPKKVSQDIEAKIKSMGIDISVSAQPVGNYVNAVRSGNLLFLSGKGPKKPALIDGKQTDGSFVTGKLGKDLTVDQGYQAARYAGILQLAALKAELGDLNKIKRIVKINGSVNSVPEFTDQPKVINGCSDLMVEVFGEKGKHARAAVGVSSLPGDWAVEIEMIVEVK